MTAEIRETVRNIKVHPGSFKRVLEKRGFQLETEVRCGDSSQPEGCIASARVLSPLDGTLVLSRTLVWVHHGSSQMEMPHTL